MVNTLERALAEVANLPEETQERIGQELLAHVARLHELRKDLEQGMISLDTEPSRKLDVEDILRRAHQRHGKA